jgi:hypothetical protein
MNRYPPDPPRLAHQPPSGDAFEERVRQRLQALQAPPDFHDAASARLDHKVAAAARATPRRVRWLVLFLPPALAVAVAAVVVLPGRPTVRQTFHTRGPAQGPSATSTTADRSGKLLVFRIGPGGRAEPLGATLRRNDELAFAYQNDGRAQRLLVFGRDEHGHVYWYHPAWTDPRQNPQAIPLSDQPGLHELPAAIAQPLDGRTLEICWLFTAHAVGVRELEAGLAGADEGGLARRGLVPQCRQVELVP